MPRAMRVVVALLLTGLLPGVAYAGLVRVSNATPIVPKSDRAYIFDTFGSNPAYKQSAASIAKVRSLLQDEHYKVTTFTGKSATLANFKKMKGAGVILISTHAFDPAVDPRDRPCEFSKGLTRVSDVAKYDPRAAKYAGEFFSCPGQPLMLVQAVGGKRAMVHAYVDARIGGWGANDIFPVESTNGIFGLAIMQAGIRKVFGGDPPGLIFASACYSISLASSFGASSYFGYHSTTYDCEDGKEIDGLFDRLAGREGVDERDTASAWRAGGFDDDNFETAIKQPIVLSPAVTSVDPGPPDPPATAIALKAGTQTPLTVKFDARMDSGDPQSVVSVSGCGATIGGAKWSDEDTLTATLSIPATSTGGQMTFTIDHGSATGDGASGPHSQLDGNQSPSPDSGVSPNASDYTWTLPCERTAYNLHVEYRGTLNDSYAPPPNESGGSSISMTFDESRDSVLNFTPPLSAMQGAVTENVSGSISAPSESCTIGPGSNPNSLNLGADDLNSVTLGSTVTNTFTVETQMPLTINIGQVSVSGSDDNCYAATADGLEIQPASFVHPSGGVYDPGGMLGAAEESNTAGVNITSLPYTHSFPFSFVVDESDGGTDTVSGSGTVTVTENP